MSRQWYSVEQVAELLGLHVKTVRGYIRDGRLAAVRMGRQYRISRAELAEFTGESPGSAPSNRHVEVSTFVRIDGLGRESMDRLTTMILSALPSDPNAEPLRVETVYDEPGASLKIIVIGGMERTAELLQLIKAIEEQV